MSLIAITREVSPDINQCELSFQTRRPIDLARAINQHRTYCECLKQLVTEMVVLPTAAGLPDSVFVEDPALVLDEIAIMTNMGAASRRAEAKSLADSLRAYRLLKFMVGPGTLEGGDVLRIHRSVFVGLSTRTNRAGLEQLRTLLAPFEYQVREIEVHGCLHLKSACSYIGQNTLLINRPWIDVAPLREFELLDVPAEEPNAANVLCLNDSIILPASFPMTRALLQNRGFPLLTIDVSELQKAEAGVTCCSLIFQK